MYALDENEQKLAPFTAAFATYVLLLAPSLTRPLSLPCLVRCRL